MKPFSARVYIYIIVFLIILIQGCAQHQKPVLLKLGDLPEEGVCRIAVLPFMNESEFEEGNIIFYRVFVAEFNRLGNFQLAPEGDVRDVYKKMKLTAGYQSPDFNQLRIIGNYLNVPLLLQGYIKEMKEVSVSRNTMQPQLAVNLKLFDVRKGQTVWSTYYSREGEEYRKILHFGLINNMTRLARQISEEILNLWKSEGFIEKCSELTD